MVKLTYNELESLEDILEMKTGYVSDFSNKGFENFMGTFDIEIYNDKYKTNGNSKANLLRTFIKIEENNNLVAKIIKELIEREVIKKPEIIKNPNYNCIIKCINRLNTNNYMTNDNNDIDEFLKKEFNNIDIKLLTFLDDKIKKILEYRIKEIIINMKNKNYLSAIILIGSTLEGILLSLAENNQDKFNKSKTAPKDKENKVLKFKSWTLSSLIYTAYTENFINLDIKKFSHVLRDFRNYIHPYEQLTSNFDPNEDTIKISWQVLIAAINNLNETTCKN